jgi:hypothetical protein
MDHILEFSRYNWKRILPLSKQSKTINKLNTYISELSKTHIVINDLNTIKYSKWIINIPTKAPLESGYIQISLDKNTSEVAIYKYYNFTSKSIGKIIPEDINIATKYQSFYYKDNTLSYVEVITPDEEDDIEEFIDNNLDIDYEFVNMKISNLLFEYNHKKEENEKLKSTIDKRTEILNKYQDLGDYLVELEEIRDSHTNRINNETVIFNYQIKGIEVEPTHFSKTSYNSYSTVKHKFDEAKLVITDNLLKIMHILKIAKERIHKDYPDLLMKTHFKNNSVEVIFYFNV